MSSIDSLEERARKFPGHATTMSIVKLMADFARAELEQAAKIAEMPTLGIASRHEIAAAIRAYAAQK